MLTRRVWSTRQRAVGLRPRSGRRDRARLARRDRGADPVAHERDGTPRPESVSDSEIASLIGADPRLRVGEHRLSHGPAGLAGGRGSRRGDRAGDRRGFSCGASGRTWLQGACGLFLRGPAAPGSSEHARSSSYRSPRPGWPGGRGAGIDDRRPRERDERDRPVRLGPSTKFAARAGVLGHRRAGRRSHVFDAAV